MDKQKIIYVLYLLATMFIHSRSPANPNEVIATGGQIKLRDGEFKIAIPKGWSVYTNIPGQTLLAQGPKQGDVGFRRAIQVMTFGGPRYLDEVTATEFNELIARKFEAASTSMTNYQMNNHMRVELADRRPALLFYSEFEQDQKKYMQAHLLVSNLERHFLMSYTDAAEHFANDARTPNLNEAWQSLISAEVEGPTPVRYRIFFQVGGMVGLLLVSMLGLGLYRKLSHRKYEQELKSEFSEDLSTVQNKPPKQVSGPSASLYEDQDEIESLHDSHDRVPLDESDEAQALKKVKKPKDDGIAG